MAGSLALTEVAAVVAVSMRLLMIVSEAEDHVAPQAGSAKSAPN
jgi:hypothetical protein